MSRTTDLADNVPSLVSALGAVLLWGLYAVLLTGVAPLFSVLARGERRVR